MNKVRQLTQLLQEFSIPLVVGVVAGLAAANIDQASYEKLVDYHLFGADAAVFGRPITVEFLINEMFMVFFFGVAAKEIVESALPGGALNPVNRAINPLVGTLGGVLGPAGLYLLPTFVFYGGSEDFSDVANGWAIPTATDIALAWLVARLVFGRGHPAVNFLLLLAVADDAIGLGIIAIFYPDPDHPAAPIWLLLTGGGMALAFAMRRVGVKTWVPYVVIPGAMSWIGLIKTSIAPALTLVAIVPFMPGPKTGTIESPEADQPHGETRGDASAAHVHTHEPSTLDLFDRHTRLFVDFGLFFFAFANAGVAFGSINEVTAIVLVSLIVGKTVGISVFSWAAAAVGFPLPSGMGMKHLVIAGLVAGLGLTVALFVAGEAFPESPFEEPAKMGAVLSIVVAPLALLAGIALKVKDIAPTRAKKS